MYSSDPEPLEGFLSYSNPTKDSLLFIPLKFENEVLKSENEPSERCSQQLFSSSIRFVLFI